MQESSWHANESDQPVNAGVAEEWMESVSTLKDSATSTISCKIVTYC